MNVKYYSYVTIEQMAILNVTGRRTITTGNPQS